MRSCSTLLLQGLALLALSSGQSVSAADADLDALSLQSAPPAPSPVMQPTKIFVEAAAGIAQQRDDLGSREIGRLSVDVRHAGALGSALRYTASARLDATSPVAGAGVTASPGFHADKLAWKAVGTRQQACAEPEKPARTNWRQRRLRR